MLFLMNKTKDQIWVLSHALYRKTKCTREKYIFLDTILCQFFDPTLDKNLEYLMAKNVANSWSLVSFMASSYSAEVPSKFPLLLSRFILFSLTIIMPGTALSNSAKISDAFAAFP